MSGWYEAGRDLWHPERCDCLSCMRRYEKQRGNWLHRKAEESFDEQAAGVINRLVILMALALVVGSVIAGGVIWLLVRFFK